jgi:hypothetical protein
MTLTGLFFTMIGGSSKGRTWGKTMRGITTILVAIVLSSSVRAQTYDELAAMVEGPWHHVPNPVTKWQLERDDARCRVVAAQTQVDSTTPAIVARVRWTTQINCMKALGYEPGPAPPVQRANSRRTKGGLVEIKAAGGGVGVTPCSEFNQSREKPEIEAMFFSWAEGYLTGWNIGLPEESQKHVDLSLMPRSEQMEFLRKWCEANPSKRYVDGATTLLIRLRVN